MIASFAKFFRLLSSDIEPYQLSLGICLGIVAGLSPMFCVQSVVVFLLLWILRANLSVFFLSFGLVSLIAYLADPLIATVGEAVLKTPSLEPLFTDMYNNGFWRLLNFNNTVAMGSLVISLISFIPILLFLNLLINRYRTTIERYWKHSALFTFLKKSKLIGHVASISEKVS